jgi:8-oxo-dGTP diphosphatase
MLTGRTARMEGDMLLVVRHAAAGDKRSWAGSDLLRPLTPAGRRQAAGLVERLEDFPIEQILSSPAVRCLETVEPLAHDRYLPVDPLLALGVDFNPAEILGLIGDRRRRGTVLCSHGEMITWLLAHLTTNGLVTDAPLAAAKGSTWLLEPIKGWIHARYLPPLALERTEEMAGRR